ncbi:MAG: alpha/beta fold hydrolase [Candidatus Acidiferrum sp.]
MKQGPGGSLVEKVSQIWQRIFQRTEIRFDENFFSLGGDPWMAIQLFAEIEKATGRLFSPMVIYQAPTIASLSAFLESSQPPPLPKCILLKPGNTEPSVFLMHGLGGNIMEFFNMVKHLQESRAVYGLQARGTDGLEEPLSSIEQMAQFYVDAIKELKPHGPYLLVGYSLGGLVAIEMARRLIGFNEEVALLVMIDSYPPIRYAPPIQRLRVYARKATNRGRRIFRPESPEQSGNNLGRVFTPPMLKVQVAARKALAEYQPRLYPGKIKFVRASDPLHFPDDPARVWAKFVEQMVVQTVAGNHQELLTTYYEPLAAVISRYLAETLGEEQTGSLYR